MPRNLSAALKSELLKHATGEGLLPLLTIEWDDGVLQGVLRFARANISYTSGGNLFESRMFELELPDEDDSELPLMLIRVDGVDRLIRQAIRPLNEAATGTLDIARISAPNDIEISLSGKVRRADFENFTLLLEIHLYAELAEQQYPSFRYSPASGFISLR